MSLFKRIAPFVLTLLVGLLLGGFANSFRSSRVGKSSNAVSEGRVVRVEEGGGRRACRSYRRERVNSDRSPSVVMFKPPARMTPEARRRGTSGIVRVHLRVNADGTVSDVTALNTLPFGLTEEAIDAAKRTKFSPATLYGQPISEERSDLTFEFGLN